MSPFSQGLSSNILVTKDMCHGIVIRCAIRSLIVIEYASHLGHLSCRCHPMQHSLRDCHRIYQSVRTLSCHPVHHSLRDSHRIYQSLRVLIMSSVAPFAQDCHRMYLYLKVLVMSLSSNVPSNEIIL